MTTETYPDGTPLFPGDSLEDNPQGGWGTETNELKATVLLRIMGGRAKNRYAVAQQYHTRNGHASVKFGYRALSRAISADQITLRPDGSIVLKDEA